MKIGVVRRENESIVALETDGRWLDFTRVHRIYELMDRQRLGLPIRNVLELLRAGIFERAALTSIIKDVERHGAMEKCVLTRPISFELPFRPGKIVAIGRNYAAHAAETGHDVPTEPIFFAKSPTSCIGPEQPIVTRPEYGRVDHEGELGVVIGRTVKDIRPEDVRESIAAYTLVNDVTAREMQKKDIEAGHPWFRSKSLDTFCPVGPYVVLRDALPWPLELDITCTVNGEVRQHSNTRQLIFKLPELIAYVSRFITLEPGDLVSTGTPEGIGPVKPGDTIEVRIPEIGVLRNPVMGVR